MNDIYSNSDLNLDYIVEEIVNPLVKVLDRCGFYYRIFYRQKSVKSINNKMILKAETYRQEGRKMQDIIGIRVACYFIEDVQLIYDYLISLDNNERASNSVDEIDTESFKPQRRNLIFRLSSELSQHLSNQLQDYQYKDLIDNTYEIQLRSVLSEGWHEVEHDLRYKCKTEWSELMNESRMLNGIYATLETSERAMSRLFQDVAYTHFKNRNWAAMFRNHFYMKTISDDINPDLQTILDNNQDISKQIFRFPKKELINALIKLSMPFPLNINNLILIINRLSSKNEAIANIETTEISQILDLITIRN